MNDAMYWVFFGLMPATFVLLGWTAVWYNRRAIESAKRKSATNR
jgi:hypothetical protein